jgi:hypothetical protein
MRTTDDLNPEPAFKPFGPKVEKPKPSQPPHTAPQGDYGIVTLPDGTMRTTRDNLPKYRASVWEFWELLP